MKHDETHAQTCCVLRAACCVLYARVTTEAQQWYDADRGRYRRQAAVSIGY